MGFTFLDASKFLGEGIDKWITSSVTDLSSTFNGASAMNSDLGGWSTSKVTLLYGTFQFATKVIGNGISNWDVSKVKDMTHTFSASVQVRRGEERKRGRIACLLCRGCVVTCVVECVVARETTMNTHNGVYFLLPFFPSAGEKLAPRNNGYH